MSIDVCSIFTMSRWADCLSLLSSALLRPNDSDGDVVCGVCATAFLMHSSPQRPQTVEDAHLHSAKERKAFLAMRGRVGCCVVCHVWFCSPQHMQAHFATCDVAGQWVPEDIHGNITPSPPTLPAASLAYKLCRIRRRRTLIDRCHQCSRHIDPLDSRYIFFTSSDELKMSLQQVESPLEVHNSSGQRRGKVRSDKKSRRFCVRYVMPQLS